MRKGAMRKCMYEPMYYVLILFLEDNDIKIREKGFRAFSNVLRCYFLEMAKENVIMAKIIRKDNRGRRYEVRLPYGILDGGMYKHTIELY